MFDVRVGTVENMANRRPAYATIGYAADEQGRGIVYARLSAEGKVRVLRAGFSSPGAGDARAAGFAALSSMIPRLRKMAENIELAIDDAELVDDLNARRELPVPLMLPYVRTRCALNAFTSCRLTATRAPSDLAARARAEVSTLIAA